MTDTTECEWGIDEEAEGHADGEQAEREAKQPYFWTVAVYLCDQAYGGPEEGGWWYEYGTRIDDREECGLQNWTVPRVCMTQDEAYECAKVLQGALDAGINADGRNRDLSSVNCEGRYCAEVHRGYPPAHYPERRPHYE